LLVAERDFSVYFSDKCSIAART